MPMLKYDRISFCFWLLASDSEPNTIGSFPHSKHFLRFEYLRHSRKTCRDPKLACRISNCGSQMGRCRRIHTVSQVIDREYWFCPRS